ncbi:MAG: zinc ribbon domain-containing protein [Thermoplasmata archaeon]|nr:zinc ribbon domain-containing protein [Thermoplasmata archaeon]
MLTCPSCGAPVEEGALFCPACRRTVPQLGPTAFPVLSPTTTGGLGLPPSPPPPAAPPPPDWIPLGLVGKALHCPRCNTLISTRAVVCPACLSALPLPAADAGGSVPPG